MEVLNQSFPGRNRNRFAPGSTTDIPKSQPVSKLIILQARFQQKQLQEKEEKLLKLYEEQQERAMNRVGARVQSGGSSVSSTSSVGRGKVRHMFQTRRGPSESSKQGRDRSYPLEPLKSNLSVRTQSLNLEQSQRTRAPLSRSSTTFRARGTLNRHNSDLQLRQVEDYYRDLEEDSEEEEEEEEEEYYRRGTVRRTQSQVRTQKPSSKLLYFGGSHTDLRFSDESDYVQTFHVIDDHYEIPDRDHGQKNGAGKGSFPRGDEYFINNFNDKREFYENRLRSDGDLLSRNADLFEKLPNVGMNRSNLNLRKEPDARPTRFKSFVSQKPFPERTLSGSGVAPGRKAEVAAVRDTVSPPSRQPNGRATSPVVKLRKPTPMPTSVAPKQPVVQTKRTNVPVRQSPAKEAVPPVPASRTTVARPPSAAIQSEKPPMGKKTPRVTPPIKSNLHNDLPSCQHCGRHFAEDRISKHQEICKKSSKSKRKPFDSVKQRVKGTEAEQFLKGGKLRGQTQKQVKPPQKDWRKTHEEFINSIRAARDYQTASSQGRKQANPRPPTSRY